MASGVDGDNEECIETWRLTGRDGNSIQCMMQYIILVFCSYKVHDFYTTFQMLPGDGI
jgi:hypothetical protein